MTPRETLFQGPGLPSPVASEEARSSGSGFPHPRDRPGLWAAAVSLLLYAVLAYLLLAPRGEPAFPEWGFVLSLSTAAANGLTFLLLGAAWWAIRTGRARRHRLLMELALASILGFLILYVGRQYLVGTFAFGGAGLLRVAYLAILLPHLAISSLAIPPVVYNFLVGLTRPLHEVASTLHPRVGRVVVPLWMTSSAMGLVVFGLLQVFPVP